VEGNDTKSFSIESKETDIWRKILNKTDMNEDSKNIWKVLKTEPENYDTTSLYLDSEGNDKSFSKRRAGHYPTLRVMGEDGWYAFAADGLKEMTKELNLNVVHTLRQQSLLREARQSIFPPATKRV